ncbi:protein STRICTOSIDINE SYNTHASE-LIKE 12 [Prunus persica]|uniref:protein STRICTOSIDINE SYNTHASE-LIKE 12 n=1 Tax=Prunus persica TaxID=3760 RepID=UPI0009AB5177|nr:protein STRICTOSIDINE SYNTHASE-LIKE 12 [Prunus persica]
MVEVRCGRASEELREEEVDVDPRRRWSVTRGVVDQRSNNISNICERKTWLVEVKRGIPFRFLNGLDIDPITGIVYFTEATSVYEQYSKTCIRMDKTKQVRVLLRGLSLAFGTASMDGSFVLVSEYAGKRIQKSWLTGPKANTSEIILDFGHHPVDINRSVSGDFWVAVNRETRLINHRGKLIVPNALLIDSDGAVLDEIILLDQYGNLSITQVEEVAGAL